MVYSSPMFKWLTVKQAADKLSMDEETIRRSVRAGKLKAYKPTSRLRISEIDLDNWVKGENSGQAEQS